MSKTWTNMTAADLGRAIDKGTINPVELCEAFLDKIASHPLASRIYARTTPARARGEAMGAASRAKTGQRKGLLDGVPISWKDLFDTAGVETEAGSALLKGRVPHRFWPQAARLILIILRLVAPRAPSLKRLRSSSCARHRSGFMLRFGAALRHGCGLRL
jgi:Asp-tRNA(Asn)/Glu-tRNA(Gln) amidotransferase A subunit family amidase